jgi:queuine tRNA-ribosyltransferase
VRARSGAARAGTLATAHGPLETPAFLPVGTHAAVRGLTPAELLGVGVQGILANTYHLLLRPGAEVVERLGGLHRFMSWPGPILTDSGGYQLYSLDHLSKRSEEGVEFRSPVDGTLHRLTPETAIELQERLGADLVVVLDEFEPIAPEPGPDAEARARELALRTLRWAARGLARHRRGDQLLFGIVQGGGLAALRQESARATAALGFRAFAIGGLGVGEPPELRGELLGAALAPLPDPAPRYLMGLGRPEDLVAAVAAGVDLFDCVVPTRHGRHGVAFTARGPVQVRNARWREEQGPLDPDCACPVCTSFSAAYVRHLLVANEMLGPRLLSHHNLAFYSRLMRQMREAIDAGRFAEWRDAWEASYSPEPGNPSAATESPA